MIQPADWFTVVQFMLLARELGDLRERVAKAMGIHRPSCSSGNDGDFCGAWAEYAIAWFAGWLLPHTTKRLEQPDQGSDYCGINVKGTFYRYGSLLFDPLKKDGTKKPLPDLGFLLVQIRGGPRLARVAGWATTEEVMAAPEERVDTGWAHKIYAGHLRPIEELMPHIIPSEPGRWLRLRGGVKYDS